LSGAKVGNWQLALNRHLMSVMATPFEWGTHDCFLFWVNCERVIYGDSVFDDIDLTYSSEDEALQILSSHDCSSVFDAANKRLEQIPVEDAVFGDLVGYYADDTPALGLYANGSFVAPASKRLMSMPARKIEFCWRRKNG
jgi:hypothetical protein